MDSNDTTRGVPPGVGFTPGGLYPNRGSRSGQRMKTGNNENKSPTRKTDA
jgi:hypothetical protein